jgi:hypothetical protein
VRLTVRLNHGIGASVKNFAPSSAASSVGGRGSFGSVAQGDGEEGLGLAASPVKTKMELCAGVAEL